MTRPRALLVAVAVACASLGVGAPLAAQDAERQAAERFEAGTAAYQRGEYRAAAEQFEQALRLAPRAATAYSAALAWEGAGERGRAADAFETALAQPGLSDAEAGDAQARLAGLNRLLGVVAVTAPLGGTVDAAHARALPIPARIHAAPGLIEVVVVAPGGARSTRTVDVIAGRTTTVAGDTKATLPRPPAAGGKPAPPGPRVAPAVAPPPADPDAERPPATGTVLGATLVGAGAIGGAVAIVLGVKAVDTRDAFVDGGSIDVEQHDDAIALRTATNVAWISAGVLAAGGLVLLIASRSSASTATAVRRAPPTLVWRF